MNFFNRALKPLDRAPSAQHMAYRPDIDGLRSVAVLSVVLYHLGVGPVKGGFVGVDVFFVISGYLITAALAISRQATILSIILEFYERRCRRIFPALFVVALFCLAASAIFFPPDDFLKFGQSLAAASLFASNLYFCLSQNSAGYFSIASETQILLHTWSLAVEEQFYIAFPIVFIVVRRWARGFEAMVLLGFAILSFLYSAWALHASPLAAFYLVSSRAWELLLGSLLSLQVVPVVTLRWISETMCALGMSLILYAIFAFSNNTPFPGAAALVPCAGAALVIWGSGRRVTMVGRMLSTRPAVFTGLISYSLYLWHWPLIVLVKYLHMGTLNTVLRVIILLVSFGVAYLSYRFVESPFRGRTPLLGRRYLFGSAAALVLGTALCGVMIVEGQGFPQRFDQQTRQLMAANLAQQQDQTALECDNYKRPLSHVDDISLCRLGQAQRNILFWGDSHVISLQPLIESLFNENKFGGRGALLAVSSGCPPSLTLNRTSRVYQCDEFNRLVLARASADDIDTVFIGFFAWWDASDPDLCLAKAGGCSARLSRSEAIERIIEDLRTSILQLKQRGKRIILQLPEPSYERSIPAAEIQMLSMGGWGTWLQPQGLAPTLMRRDNHPLREKLTIFAKTMGITVYDPREAICKGDICQFERGHVSIYVDNQHIAAKEIGMFRAGLLAAISDSDRDR